MGRVDLGGRIAEAAGWFYANGNEDMRDDMLTAHRELANLLELVRVQHEALAMMVEMVDMCGFGKDAAIDNASAALAKYNEMMGEE